MRFSRRNSTCPISCDRTSQVLGQFGTTGLAKSESKLHLNLSRVQY